MAPITDFLPYCLVASNNHISSCGYRATPRSPGMRLLTGSPNAGPRATPLATPHQKISSTPVHQRVLAPWPLPLSVQTMSWLTTSPLRMMNKMVQFDPLRHRSHRPPQSLEGFVCQSLLSLQEGRREIPNRDSLHWPKAFSLAKGFPNFVCPPSFPFFIFFCQLSRLLSPFVFVST